MNSLENIEISTREILNGYIEFICARAKGLAMTNAMWMREFVKDDPRYQHDSIVNEQIQYDLIWKIQQIHHQEDLPEKISTCKY